MVVQSLKNLANLEKSGNKIRDRANLEKSGNVTERDKNDVLQMFVKPNLDSWKSSSGLVDSKPLSFKSFKIAEGIAGKYIRVLSESSSDWFDFEECGIPD